MATEDYRSQASQVDYLGDRPVVDIRFDLQINRPGSIPLVDQINLTRIPAGSLRVEYRGAYKPLMRHAHRRFRRLWQEANEDRLAFASLRAETQLAQEQMSAWADLDNGRWWDREWFDSLPAEKGGAPTTPYVHYVGQDVDIELGPLVVSNTLKFKMKSLAMLQFDTDPDQQLDPAMRIPSRLRQPNFTLNVEPDKSRELGTYFKARVRPRLSVGLPGKRIESALRYMSLRGTVEMFISKKRVLAAECEVAVKDAREIVVTVDIALLSW